MSNEFIVKHATACSGKVIATALPSITRCPLCLKEYSGDYSDHNDASDTTTQLLNPCIFPCGHSICRYCLTLLIRHYRSCGDAAPPASTTTQQQHNNAESEEMSSFCAGSSSKILCKCPILGCDQCISYINSTYSNHGGNDTADDAPIVKNTVLMSVLHIIEINRTADIEVDLINYDDCNNSNR